jgi:hypothetical protein
MDVVVATIAGVLLILSALFAAVTWPALFRRIVRDPRARDADGNRTTFYTVHRNLTAVALALALLSLVAGVLVFAYLVASPMHP